MAALAPVPATAAVADALAVESLIRDVSAWCERTVTSRGAHGAHAAGLVARISEALGPLLRDAPDGWHPQAEAGRLSLHRDGAPDAATAGPARRAAALLLAVILALGAVAGLTAPVAPAPTVAAPWCAGAAAGCGQRVAARVLTSEGLPGVGAPTAPSSDDDCRPGGLPGCDEILGEWDAVTPSYSQA